jgi:hypothetical protein
MLRNASTLGGIAIGVAGKAKPDRDAFVPCIVPFHLADDARYVCSGTISRRHRLTVMSRAKLPNLGLV